MVAAAKAIWQGGGMTVIAVYKYLPRVSLSQSCSDAPLKWFITRYGAFPGILRVVRSSRSNLTEQLSVVQLAEAGTRDTPDHPLIGRTSLHWITGQAGKVLPKTDGLLGRRAGLFNHRRGKEASESLPGLAGRALRSCLGPVDDTELHKLKVAKKKVNLPAEFV